MEGSVPDYPSYEGEHYAQEVVERTAFVKHRQRLPCGCHHVFTPDTEGDHEPEFDPAAELAIINARIAELDKG
jgi:hypothetical protein